MAENNTDGDTKPEDKRPPKRVAGEDAPLFDATGDDRVAYIMVHRVDPPIEEGILGKLTPDATEMDLKKRWGGGTFLCEARTDEHRHVKGGKKRVSIAGDPIFTSKLAEKKWQQLNGMDAMNPANTSADGHNALDMMLAMFKMQNDQAQQAHQRQLEIMREENRRRDEEARREREDRERRNEDERRRDREHQKSMIELFQVKQGKDQSSSFAETLKLLTVAKDLFGGGGDDGKDPLTAMAESLPEIVGAVRDERAMTANPAAAAGAAPARNPNDITLTGQTAELAKQYLTISGEMGISAQDAIDAGLAALIENAQRAKAQRGGAAPPPNGAPPNGAPPRRAPQRPERRPPPRRHRSQGQPARPPQAPPAPQNGAAAKPDAGDHQGDEAEPKMRMDPATGKMVPVEEPTPNGAPPAS